MPDLTPDSFMQSQSGLTPESFMQAQSQPPAVRPKPSEMLPQPQEAVAGTQDVAQRLLGGAKTLWDALNTSGAQSLHDTLGTGKQAATVSDLYEGSVAPLVHTLAEPFQTAPLVGPWIEPAINAAGRTAAGLADFTQTPLGVATGAAAKLPSAIQKLVGAGFTALQAPEAAKQTNRAISDPSPENVTQAIASTAAAALPMLPAAAGRIGREVRETRAEKAKAEPLLQERGNSMSPDEFMAQDAPREAPPVASEKANTPDEFMASSRTGEQQTAPEGLKPQETKTDVHEQQQPNAEQQPQGQQVPEARPVQEQSQIQQEQPVQGGTPGSVEPELQKGEVTPASVSDSESKPASVKPEAVPVDTTEPAATIVDNKLEPSEGPHGPVLDQFRHDAAGAVAELRDRGTGDAAGALHHPQIGDIDLVYGKAGDPAKSYEGGYGLAHIDAKHPGIGDQLQGILDHAEIERASPNRIELKTPGDQTALVRLDWDKAAKKWLLTAFDQDEGKAPSTEGSTDVPGTRAAEHPLPGGNPSLPDKPAGSNIPEAIASELKPSENNPERGGVSPELLTLGAEKFYRQDVKPAVQSITQHIADSARDIQKTLLPTVGDRDAHSAALIMRGNMAEVARKSDQARDALASARAIFDRQEPHANYAFMDRVERGEQQATPELQQIADTVRPLLDDRRQQVQDLGTGKLENFYQNYFPHIWDNSKKATEVFGRWFSGKAPLEGSKAFLKQRSIPTIADGIAAGLKPISDNPVDLVLAKAREMDKYIMAHRTLSDWEGSGLAKLVPRGMDAPAGWSEISDPIAQTKGGAWYVPEGAATILNNYLTPGLRAKSGIYRSLTGLNNVINQAQLGLSAFHLGFTSAEAAISKVALGLEQAIDGRPIAALKSVASAPAAPFTNYIQGDKLLKEWSKPGSQGGEIAALVDHLVAGGGRAHMDGFYETNAAQNMMKALRSGNFLGGIVRAPGALIDTIGGHIMREIVPRQKLGVFADLARAEMDRLGPDAKHEDVQKAMAQAWDSVENRMGQMTYDNLFWNRTAKDLAMLTTRSVGWNLGTIRELGGAPVEAGKALLNAVQGNNPLEGVNRHKLAYAAALPLVNGVMGAMYQYLHTGKGPEELKDYFFPRTGNLDERGNPERVSMPTYAKDVYHYATEPGTTIGNKVAPMWSLVAQMVRNKDYFGTEIRNADDPLVKQMLDAGKFAAQGLEPFSIRNLERSKSLGAPAERQAENFFGIQSAPRSLNQSAAERLAEKISIDRRPPGTRTSEEKARADARHDVTRLSAQGKPIGDTVRKYVEAGTLSMKDVHSAIQGSRVTPLQRQFRSFGIRDALRVWDKAEVGERATLRPMLAKKVALLKDLPAEQQKQILPKIKEALSAPKP